MTTEIEKNVPMPTNRETNGRWSSLWKSMEIGDSFVVKTPNEASAARMAISQYKSRHPELGLGYASRTQPDKTTRFWRIA